MQRDILDGKLGKINMDIDILYFTCLGRIEPVFAIFALIIFRLHIKMLCKLCNLRKLFLQVMQIISWSILSMSRKARRCFLLFFLFYLFLLIFYANIFHSPSSCGFFRFLKHVGENMLHMTNRAPNSGKVLTNHVFLYFH